ncbi:hypothetical protein [Legionella sp.]|uniref:hypothetical protein n=1 Tax=Legionella sp. TaxID=459 RepID=UPI003C86F3F1
MTKNAEHFIATADGSRLSYLQVNFSSVEQQNILHGLYAYITYETPDDKIYVLRAFQPEGSNHSGMAMYFKSYLPRHLSQFIPEIQERLKKICDQKPAYGGEILLFKNEVISWNFKSNTFSNKEIYNETNPQFENIINQTGLSKHRFMNIKNAEIFATQYKEFFNGDGTYINAKAEIKLKKHFSSTINEHCFFNTKINTKTKQPQENYTNTCGAAAQ